ncbi:MAG TPA: ribonuclease E/G [Caulobacteraceae bacterium]
MSRRRYLLDIGPGQQRGVALLDGRPERLILSRDTDISVQGCGARLIARVRKLERRLGLAFLDLGEGPDAVLNLKPEHPPLVEGAWIEIVLRAEARLGKGGLGQFVGLAEGPHRLIEAASDAEAQLRTLANGAPIETGSAARAAIDAVEEMVLEPVHPLPNGGSLAIEPTRALVAVDVDVGAGGGTSPKHATRAANLAAIAETARLLRLKGLGGLVAIDLAGRGHDGQAILAAARASFAADNPGVSLGAISRFGLLELTVPRRSRGALEILSGDGGLVPDAEARGYALLRALESEAQRSGGARIEARAAPAIAAVARPFLIGLTARFGERLAIAGAPQQGDFEVIAR